MHFPVNSCLKALRCVLEELTDQPAWTAECYLWLCHNVVNMADCSMKVYADDIIQ